MQRTTHVWNVLRFAYGAVLVLAGLDKLLSTNLIVNWAQYISPPVAAALPVSTGIFLIAMGIVEVVVGLMFFNASSARLAGYLAMAWLILISINLLMLDLRDIAIRDLLLAVGAYAIAQLSAARERPNG